MTREYHVISHTHWDREWYQCFEHFRLRLVALMDGLLAIFKNDPREVPTCVSAPTGIQVDAKKIVSLRFE